MLPPIRNGVKIRSLRSIAMVVDGVASPPAAAGTRKSRRHRSNRGASAEEVAADEREAQQAAKVWSREAAAKEEIACGT